MAWTVLGLSWMVTLPGLRARLFADGVAYLAVAQHLVEGRFDLALNAYWSPLYSWLLAPFLAVGVQLLLATKLVGLVAAVLAMWGMSALLGAAGCRGRLRLLALLALVPFLVWAASWTTPDLLLGGWLLVWLARMIDDRSMADTRFAVVTGVLAGLAVLVKLFALPLVLATVPLLLALHVWRSPTQWRCALRAHLVAFAGFAVVVAAWGAVLSVSEGRVTLGDAAAVNLDVGSARSEGSGVYNQGLIPPPHEHAVSVWEDPGMVPPSEAPDEPEQVVVETSFGSVVAERWETVVANAKHGSDAMSRWRWLAPVALLGLVVALAPGRLDERSRRTVLAGCVLAGVNTGGLLLVWVEARYLWPTLLALVPAVVVGLRWLGESVSAVASRAGGARPREPRSLPHATTVVVTLGLMAVLVLPGVRAIQAGWNESRLLINLANELEDESLAGARVASANGWAETLLLCFHADCVYYGLTSPRLGPDWATELESERIDAYLVWDEDTTTLGEGQRYEAEGMGGTRTVRLYRP